jgi:hypothetical protein
VINRTAAIAVVLLSSISLVACTGSPDPMTDSPSEHVTDASDVSDATSCLLGTWHLDVPDYEAQAQEYFAANGLPADSLALSGTQSVVFTDSRVSVDQALEFTATVSGQTLSQPFTAQGDADWAWVDEGESLQLDNATWMPETPADSGASPVPSMGIPGNGMVTVECTASTLHFAGEGATLAGNFTR